MPPTRDRTGLLNPGAAALVKTLELIDGDRPMAILFMAVLGVGSLDPPSTNTKVEVPFPSAEGCCVITIPSDNHGPLCETATH